MGLYIHQRKSVTWKKTAAGWLDGSTPTYVFTLNAQGRSVIVTSLVRYLKENTSYSKSNSTYGLVQLNPLPGPIHPSLEYTLDSATKEIFAC